MGWVKQETMTDDELFEAITNELSYNTIVWNMRKNKENAYGYVGDYIKDYYDVTLKQCDRVTERLLKHFGLN